MRISAEWLSEYVPVPEPERLEEILLMAGLGIDKRDGDEFHLEVTSNRGDWLSAIGLAREIGAMTEARFRLPSPDVDEDGPTLDGRVHADIEDAADCARIVFRLIEGVTIGPSPEWIQSRLRACGVEPINNIVDVTNYVMLEWGQPLHAYDADKIPDGHIVVRRAREGETLVTLDGIERALSPQVLTISDSTHPIGIAGVMGGESTKVTDETTRILLESAHFTPNVVRRTAHVLGMGTDASRRFERWVDPNGCKRAVDRAAQLIAQLGGGTVAFGAHDRYIAPVTDAVVELRPARASAVLGVKVTSENAQNYFERLGFKVTAGEEALRVAVPTWRRDIEREIDLVEEVARVYGYNRIPTTLHPGANTAAGRALAGRLEDRARSAMLRCGLTEVITTSLSNEPSHVTAGESVDLAVRMRNPLSEDYTLLRTSLIPGLLEVLRRNNGRRLRAFELGKVYLSREGEQLPYEKRVLGIALSNASYAPHWQPEAETPADFFALKAVLESVLREFGAPPVSFNPARHKSFHPGRCAAVSLDGQDLGIIGEIHPTVAEAFELANRAYVAELNFDTLVRHLALVKRHKTFSRLPPADRELAFLVPQNLPAANLVETARVAGGELLEYVRVFDVYQGERVPEGTKSLGLSLRFRAADRTLSKNEVDDAIHRIVDAASSLSAQLRS